MMKKSWIDALPYPSGWLKWLCKTPIMFHQDHHASQAMGRYLEKSIPNSCMTFIPGEGHISLIVKNAAAILKTLTAQESAIRG